MKFLLFAVLLIILISGCTAPQQAETTTTTFAAARTSTAIAATTTTQTPAENTVSGPVFSDLNGLKISGWVSLGITELNDPNFGNAHQIVFNKGKWNSDFVITATKREVTKLGEDNYNSLAKYPEDYFETSETFSAGDSAIMGIRKANQLYQKRLFAASKKGGSVLEVSYTNTKDSSGAASYQDSGALADDKALIENIAKAVWNE